MTQLTRRRFLAIAAASAAMPTMAGASAHWRGQALGAQATMRLEGMSSTEASVIFNAVQSELSRLEAIFSLYRDGSEISRLNRSGHLDAPSPELLQVLSLCASLHEASAGAFDVSVQPLWQALANGQSTDAVAMGFEKVQFDNTRVTFDRPGMAITLNGVAQGFITDRIAAFLQAQGLGNVLIDIGEIFAAGFRADGQAWQVGIANPDGALLARLSLSDRALATSAPGGMLLNAATGQGHITHPGGLAPYHSLASVSASSAALADGLSTMLCLLRPEDVEAVFDQFPDASIERLERI